MDFFNVISEINYRVIRLTEWAGIVHRDSAVIRRKGELSDRDRMMVKLLESRWEKVRVFVAAIR